MKNLNKKNLLQWQREQHKHDQRNHIDVACLHRTDRLKHYGLHLSKYVGRLARGKDDPIPFERTVIDATLVCLSSANSLQQLLKMPDDNQILQNFSEGNLIPIADAVGRFSNACEKIDHVEEFVSIACIANQDIMNWIFSAIKAKTIDIETSLKTRRSELADRQFYILD